MSRQDDIYDAARRGEPYRTEGMTTPPRNPDSEPKIHPSAPRRLPILPVLAWVIFTAAMFLLAWWVSD